MVQVDQPEALISKSVCAILVQLVLREVHAALVQQGSIPPKIELIALPVLRIRIPTNGATKDRIAGASQATPAMTVALVSPAMPGNTRMLLVRTSATSAL